MQASNAAKRAACRSCLLGGRRRLRRIGRAMRGLNYGMFSLFAGFLVVGIIDAHVRFVPFHRETRERELPEDLREGPDVNLSLGGDGIELRVDF